jgi:lysophospholipase L1-like esterase
MSMVKSPSFTSSFMNQMTTIDFSLYDIVTINLGTNDFWLNGGATIGTLGGRKDTTFDETTFYGAYRKGVEYILKANPDVKLVLITPTQLNVTEPSTNGFDLQQYVNAVKEIGAMYGLTVIDLYENSGFNKLTYTTYTIDGVHPSNAGHYVMGSYIAGVISTL